MKFTSKGGLVELAARRVDKWLEVRVTDTGIGIKKDQLGQLFQPFQRLHASTDFEGCGIGLATVARIIKRHGGKVRAESVIGEGTTIHMILPSG